jgi:hypothetical protein
MTLKYTIPFILICIPFQGLKFIPIRKFWYENILSGNPCCDVPKLDMPHPRQVDVAPFYSSSHLHICTFGDFSNFRRFFELSATKRAILLISKIIIPLFVAINCCILSQKRHFLSSNGKKYQKS